MLNSLKHLNNYSSFFRNPNVYRLKSFRKQSHILFISLLIRSYKLYLNNLSISMVSILYRMYINILFFTLKKHFFNSFYTNFVFEHFLTTTLGGYLFYDVPCTRGAVVLTYPDVFKGQSFYHLLTSTHIVLTMIYSFSVFKLSGASSLPTTRKLFTILRSPHTDKKSREQFVLSQRCKVFFDNLGLTSLLLKHASFFNAYGFQLKSSTFRYIY